MRSILAAAALLLNLDFRGSLSVGTSVSPLSNLDFDPTFLENAHSRKISQDIFNKIK
jgi:hypothetical protein